jgi:glycosyltransferase involved in cell wall biosynthesis
MISEDSICVVITTFNSEKFISSAIESVISQNIVPAEIVVIDNGSSDSTRSRVEDFDLPFFTQTKGRVGESRNFGLEKTVSPFVKFLDADDLLKPKALETLKKALKLDQSLFVYGQNLNFVDSTYPPVGRGVFAHTDVPIFSPTPLNAMVHRDVFKVFGLPQGDNFSWVRWFTEVKSKGLQATKVDEIVAMRRIHSENISHTTNSKSELFKLIRNQIANGN